MKESSIFAKQATTITIVSSTDSGTVVDGKVIFHPKGGANSKHFDYFYRLLLFLLENEKFFELKGKGYRDGIKRKKDKIGMGLSHCM